MTSTGCHAKCFPLKWHTPQLWLITVAADDDEPTVAAPGRVPGDTRTSVQMVATLGCRFQGKKKTLGVGPRKRKPLAVGSAGQGLTAELGKHMLCCAHSAALHRLPGVAKPQHLLARRRPTCKCVALSLAPVTLSATPGAAATVENGSVQKLGAVSWRELSPTSQHVEQPKKKKESRPPHRAQGERASVINAMSELPCPRQFRRVSKIPLFPAITAPPGTYYFWYASL
jgi:hypothetical protein